MDFSKLDQNEKLAVYGSAAVVIAGLISTYGGLMWLAILAAIGMLVVVFLPQLSATTSLPGSKGTLMATLGIVAAVAAVITLLQWIQFLGTLVSGAPLSTIMLIVAIVGAVVMAWAGWQELQREGGHWRFGTEAGTGARGSTATPSTATPSTTPTDPAVAAAPSSPTTAEPTAGTHADMDAGTTGTSSASLDAEMDTAPPLADRGSTLDEEDRPRDA